MTEQEAALHHMRCEIRAAHDAAMFERNFDKAAHHLETARLIWEREERINKARKAAEVVEKLREETRSKEE